MSVQNYEQFHVMIEPLIIKRLLVFLILSGYVDSINIKAGVTFFHAGPRNYDSCRKCKLFTVLTLSLPEFVLSL